MITMINDLGFNEEYINPTKGSKVCNYQVLNRATNGRNIGYYTVEIK